MNHNYSKKKIKKKKKKKNEEKGENRGERLKNNKTSEVIGLHAAEVQKKKKEKKKNTHHPPPKKREREREKKKRKKKGGGRGERTPKNKQTNKQKVFAFMLYHADYYRIIVNEYDYECRAIHDNEHHA